MPLAFAKVGVEQDQVWAPPTAGFKFSYFCLLVIYSSIGLGQSRNNTEIIGTGRDHRNNAGQAGNNKGRNENQYLNLDGCCFIPQKSKTSICFFLGL